ncbi:MAG: HEAT repeat domain-containing protein [Pyrinomonadaceae bacterium]|jgi:signal transduction histidine kinase
MARNLQKEDASQSTSSLLQALRLEDQLARQKESAEILKEFDEGKTLSLLFDALLKSPDSESRKRIVEELTKIGSAKAVEMLATIMTHDFDPEVQRAAVEALRQIGSDEAVNALLSALGSGEEWQRQVAARALGEFGSDRVIDALIEASKDYFVADAAVFSLIRIGSERATEGLIMIMLDLVHGTGMTSYNAMEGLVRLGTEKALNGLFQAWNGTVSIHRERLSMYLYERKPKHVIAPLCQRLLNKTSSSDDRKTAAEMLGMIGTENEIPLLESIWRDWSADSREVGWAARRAAEQISLREFKVKAERASALEETRAFIAHEFRHALTPLNAYVKMLDEALAQPDVDKEKLSALTARIRKQTDTAFDLVNQYMDYSRPLAPQIIQTDINSLLQQALEEFKAELENRKIILQLQLAENASAEADKQMLAQVLRNVIVNAIQAIDKDGNLVVATRLDEENIVIAVRDTGTGVKPEHLPRLFEIGFTTKSGVRGAGVGLALSKRIVEEAHNGSMAIANNADGLGATVIITLPKKQMEIKNGRHDLALADR